MGFLIRLFSAFCVATVIAQLLILGIMAAKGNLRADSVTKAIALINGIDVTGVQLEKALKRAEEQPVPTHDEIVKQRALMSQDLQVKLDALARQEESLKKLWTETQAKSADFDRRKDEFYVKVDNLEKKLVEENLRQVQQTIEELAPDQAKLQLLRMLENKRMEDVVSIIKVMSPVKRKKILGEFADQEEATKLHEVLMRMLAGEPATSLIEEARKSVVQ
jgi:hypothetical protein